MTEKSQQHLNVLLECIDLEMKEQERRYGAAQSNLKELRAKGIVIHPINVTRKSFGYADYPEITFRLPYVSETLLFKENTAIECFIDGESSVKGILLGLNGGQGEFRLFAPDFPDWIEDRGVGLKIAPDHRTSEQMKSAIQNLSELKEVGGLFEKIHGNESFGDLSVSAEKVEFRNTSLNDSQKTAVKGMISNEYLSIVHGPPGTGKTTTLIEGIRQLTERGKRVLVSAPSNAAVDHIALGLVQNGVKILRVGNSTKVDEQVFPHTPEGRMLSAKEQKTIKKLKIRAEELRKMSYQYKRKFGKEEREQRNLLIREVKQIRKEIREIQDYFNDRLFEEADAIVGTPIGLVNFLKEDQLFDTLILDEAGQALEPLAWTIFPYAKSWVLAGDPYQLPPTVLSEEATQKGFNVSILEHCFKQCQSIHFLDTQYRMHVSIAGFSSSFFYDGALKTVAEKDTDENRLTFFDTAGTGFEESAGDSGSLMNEGELSLIQGLLKTEGILASEITLISPYSAQVHLAKEQLESIGIGSSTIDSFQGQERSYIIVSLVRSNSDGNIGFLKDYRRLNVALTRAQKHLYVIGDSSTIGVDDFYGKFLEYVEKQEGYRSAWELMG